MNWPFKKKAETGYPKSFAKRLTWRIMLTLLIVMGFTSALIFMGGYETINAGSRLFCSRFVKDKSTELEALMSEFRVACINNAQVIEENIGNPDFTIDLLSDELHIQRNKLFKKINALTGVTPLYFVRMIRMKRACQLLKDGGLTVAEVAYQVGYNSPKRFAQHFKNEYGVTPSEYIKK